MGSHSRRRSTDCVLQIIMIGLPITWIVMVALVIYIDKANIHSIENSLENIHRKHRFQKAYHDNEETRSNNDVNLPGNTFYHFKKAKLQRLIDRHSVESNVLKGEEEEYNGNIGEDIQTKPELKESLLQAYPKIKEEVHQYATEVKEEPTIKVENNGNIRDGDVQNVPEVLETKPAEVNEAIEITIAQNESSDTQKSIKGIDNARSNVDLSVAKEAPEIKVKEAEHNRDINTADVQNVSRNLEMKPAEGNKAIEITLPQNEAPDAQKNSKVTEGIQSKVDENAQIQQQVKESDKNSQTTNHNNNNTVPSNVPVEEKQPVELRNDLGLIINRPDDPNAPGEAGRPVKIEQHLLSPEEKKKYEEGWDRNHFNQYASDRISLQRTINDVRPAECKDVAYPENLPDVSVIICFHNEAMSVLLRTVYSVLNRSPAHLVREIILVDDFSTSDYLKEPLENYISSLRNVKVVRSERREGLIRARLLGVAAATGTVLTFLDSHCECAEGWLEPLLAPISANRSVVTYSVIDPILDETLEYVGASEPNRRTLVQIGVLDWQLLFQWSLVPDREKVRRKSDIDPIRSPTMPGGIYSINREFFTHIGAYDQGMEIWGGENIEMSLRIWMCGGSLLAIPCSHVGHIFRKSSPYKWKEGVDVLKKNTIRLAEVWLDDYKKYYYDRIHYDLGDYGDVSERQELRRRLQCKSFQWYLDTIYPEWYIPKNVSASGAIKAKRAGGCVDGPIPPLSAVIAAQCNIGEHQYWVLSEKGEIRRDKYCLDFTPRTKTIQVIACHGLQENQQWQYREDNTLHHPISGLCLELHADGTTMFMSTCSGGDGQLWLWRRKPPGQDMVDIK